MIAEFDCEIIEWHPLDGVLPPIVAPRVWTDTWVGHRMVVAFEISRRSHERLGPSAFGNAWPHYTYDADDLRAQKERPALNVYADKGAISEAERRERDARNRTQPSSLDLDMMAQAFGWPGRYLIGELGSYMAASLNAWSEAKAMEVPLEDYLRRRMRGWTANTINHLRKIACVEIAKGLTLDKVEVGRWTGREE